MTKPSRTYDEVVSANRDYAKNFGDKGKLALPPARRFAILTCMDARLDPAKYAGLAEGDAHVIRDAGGRASDNRYLRVLFVQAAWVVLIKPKIWERHGLKPWIEAARKRLHHNVLAIALPINSPASPGASWPMTGHSRRGRSIRPRTNPLDSYSTPTATENGKRGARDDLAR